MSASLCPEFIRLSLQLVQTGVIIRELLEVRPGDLARSTRVVIGDVRVWITAAVLQFYRQPALKLLEVTIIPIDSELVTYFTGLVAAERFLWFHIWLSLVLVERRVGVPSSFLPEVFD